MRRTAAEDCTGQARNTQQTRRHGAAFDRHPSDLATKTALHPCGRGPPRGEQGTLTRLGTARRRPGVTGKRTGFSRRHCRRQKKPAGSRLRRTGRGNRPPPVETGGTGRSAEADLVVAASAPRRSPLRRPRLPRDRRPTLRAHAADVAGQIVTASYTASALPSLHRLGALPLPTPGATARKVHAPDNQRDNDQDHSPGTHSQEQQRRTAENDEPGENFPTRPQHREPALAIRILFYRRRHQFPAVDARLTRREICIRTTQRGPLGCYVARRIVFVHRASPPPCAGHARKVFPIRG